MRIICSIKNFILLTCIIFFVHAVPAEDDPFDYDQVAKEVFWGELYTYGGWTLYCGYRFEYDKKTKTGKSIAIEHIYPTSQMIEQLDCQSRMQCRESGNERFSRMEADMHNMYPVCLHGGRR